MQRSQNSIYVPAKGTRSTIHLPIADSMLHEIDRVSEELKTSRLMFIEDALATALQRHTMKTLEAQHAAGYAKYPVQPDEFDISEEARAWGDE